MTASHGKAENTCWNTAAASSTSTLVRDAPIRFSLVSMLAGARPLNHPIADPNTTAHTTTAMPEINSHLGARECADRPSFSAAPAVGCIPILSGPLRGPASVRRWGRLISVQSSCPRDDRVMAHSSLGTYLWSRLASPSGRTFPRWLHHSGPYLSSRSPFGRQTKVSHR